MSHRTSAFALFAAVLGLLGGCVASGPGETRFPVGRLTIGPGEPDISNHHLSSVLIETPDERGRKHMCSGVILAPRLVLTAGHCVCGSARRVPSPQGIDRVVLDKGSCQQSVDVTTYRYNPEQEGVETIVDPADYDTTTRHYRGTVQLPEGFQVVLIKQGAPQAGSQLDLGDYYVQSVKADLALVFLTRSVDGNVSMGVLPDAELEAGASVELVGFGTGFSAKDPGSQTTKLRRVGKNTLKSRQGTPEFEGLQQLLVDPEKILLDSPGALALAGDSGGPCFRKYKNGKGEEFTVLVGVASWSTPDASIFTSTYFHRKWLREGKKCSLSDDCRAKMLGQKTGP